MNACSEPKRGRRNLTHVSNAVLLGQFLSLALFEEDCTKCLRCRSLKEPDFLLEEKAEDLRSEKRYRPAGEGDDLRERRQ